SRRSPPSSAPTLRTTWRPSAARARGRTVQRASGWTPTPPVSAHERSRLRRVRRRLRAHLVCAPDPRPPHLECRGRRGPGTDRTQRLGKDDGAPPGERAHLSDGRRRAGRGPRHHRLGCDLAPAPHRLCHPGDRPDAAPHRRRERRDRGGARGMGRRAARSPRHRAARPGRPARSAVRHALPARAFRRPAAARWGGPCARRRSATHAPRRAVRCPRPGHAARAPGRLPGAAAPAPQDGHLRHPRSARGGARRRPLGAARGRAPPRRRHAGGAGGVDRRRGSSVPRGGARRMTSEIVTETGRHLLLVAVSVGLATLVGVPLGILLTRRPAWQRWVLGAANVVQTVPSLALFGLLIPVPLIGGIGLRTALVALTLDAGVRVRGTAVGGLRAVAPAVREAGRGLGMTDGQLLRRVELPLAASVILAGVRLATVIGIGLATIAAAIGAGGLGVFIFRGVAMVDNRTILAGGLPPRAPPPRAPRGRGRGPGPPPRARAPGSA